MADAPTRTDHFRAAIIALAALSLPFTLRGHLRAANASKTARLTSFLRRH